MKHVTELGLALQARSDHRAFPSNLTRHLFPAVRDPGQALRRATRNAPRPNAALPMRLSALDTEDSASDVYVGGILWKQQKTRLSAATHSGAPNAWRKPAHRL